MNYMEQVAKMIGVKLDEEFKVKNGKIIYKINTNGIFYLNIDKEWATASYMLMLILAGHKEIDKNTILDEAEKEYLGAVVNPFRNKVISITKLDSEEMNGYEYVCIEIKEVCVDRYYINLPYFKKGTMYKGMETDKAYSMEDLGL